eukprot:Hpha_TRINITY_DN14109_c0_g1::TRINITY_DN14109_c0_g1_i1::g.10888::m.10888
MAGMVRKTQAAAHGIRTHAAAKKEEAEEESSLGSSSDSDEEFDVGDETRRAARDAHLRRRELKNKKLAEQREKVRSRMVPLRFTIQTLQRKFDGSLLCRDMCIYFPFLLVFMIVFLNERDIEGSYWQSANIEDLLTGNEFANTPNFPGASVGDGPYFFKTFFDPLLPGDFSDWLETVVMPLVFDSGRPNTRGVLSPRLTQSIPIGALRVRNLRIRPDSCDVNTYFYPANVTAMPRFCYNAWNPLTPGNIDKEPYGHNGQLYTYSQNCGSDFVNGITAEYKMYPCGGHIVEVPFSWDFASAIEWSHNLRRGGFINATNVRFIALEMFSYNILLNSFSSHKYFWEVTEGGAWLPQNQHRSFNVFNENTDLLFEFFFYCFVLYYCGKLLTDWCSHCEEDGRCCTFFCEAGDADQAGSTYGMWNGLELINMCTFLAVLGLRILWIMESLALDFKLPWDTNGYPDELNTISNLYQFYVYFNAANCIISWLKILKYLRLNERLNILTRTLSSANQDVMAVLVVFFLVLISFAVSGYTLFGNGVARFKNIEQSISACMRMLVGDFDYLELWYENQIFAGIYFFAYTVLANFIVMNFIIGIVGTHFSKVQGDAPKDDCAERVCDMYKGIEVFVCCCRSGFFEAWRQCCCDLMEFAQRPAGLTILQYLRAYYSHQRDRLGPEKAGEIPIKFSYFLQLMPMAEFVQVREQVLQENWEHIVDEWDRHSQDDQERMREVKMKMQTEVIHGAMKDIFHLQKNILREELRRTKDTAEVRWADEEENFDFDEHDRENVTKLRDNIEDVSEALGALASLHYDMHEKATRISTLVKRERGLDH